MKTIILTLLLLLTINLSFSQEVKVKEISKTEFRIQHKFIGSEPNKTAYENRLFSMFSESTVESLHINKRYITVSFNDNETRTNIENTLLEFSRIFGYKSINIK